MKYCSVLLLVPVLLASCTWVDLTQEGARVQLLETANSSCQHLGTVTTSVKDRLGPMNRDDTKVRGELVTLARNRAAVLGGNAIVMSPPPADGEAGFDVYRCG